MGFVKEAKASTAASHAQRAAQEGRTVLAYRYDVPATSGGFSGPIGGAAEVIESIERQGWDLRDMAYDRTQSKNGAVLLLFRRPQAQRGPASHAVPATHGSETAARPEYAAPARPEWPRPPRSPDRLPQNWRD
jgi:hypothetical protein